jgi:hypothetical protein
MTAHLKLAAALVMLLGMIGACWTAYEAGADHRENALKAQSAQDAAAAELAARVKEQDLHYQLQEAQNAAKKRERKLLADAAGARGELDRLRDDLATIRHQLPSLAEAAVRGYADTASVVLRECASRYAEMAATADALDNDRQTLIEAWPR